MSELIDEALHAKANLFKNKIAPDPVARAIVASSSNLKDLYYFGASFIPTNLVYFDDKITEDQVDFFIKNIKMEELKSDERFNQRVAFRKIAVEMCHPKSTIRLFVSDFYSFDHLPGYLTIPFNFEFKDFIAYWEENKSEVFRIKSRVNKI